MDYGKFIKEPFLQHSGLCILKAVNGSRRIDEIAYKLNTARSFVSGRLSELEKRGLIKPIKEPKRRHQRNYKKYELTIIGRMAVEQIASLERLLSFTAVESKYAKTNNRQISDKRDKE